jgi:hypothetical protein
VVIIKDVTDYPPKIVVCIGSDWWSSQLLGPCAMVVYAFLCRVQNELNL